MQTDDLIAALARDLAPVRRLKPPGARLVRWLAVSLPAAALVVWGFGLRPDLAARLADPAFLLPEAAALLTALLGGYAALCAGLPDQPGWKLWLPLLPMAVWLSALGRQCLALYVQLGPDGLRVTADAMCVPAVALGGLVPAIAIVAMLRRGGHLRATHACLCGSLGAAALGAAALRLYHTEDAALMVLVWQFGAVAVLSLLATPLGRMVVTAPGPGLPHPPA